MQRLALQWRRRSVPVALVPTMGYLHAGHLSLAERARRIVGPNGRVVLSLYINPIQFGPREDLSRYPRSLARDKKLCQQAGVDLLFVPDDAQMYAGRESGNYSTYVVEEELSKTMEGVSRPTHFRGVTTIVAKLFNIVLPGAAIFGAKDFQQAAIIQRMVRDLNFPVRIVVSPTIREPDGVAMSSRTKYLRGKLRPQAAALWQAIQKAQAAARTSRRPIPATQLRRQLIGFIERQPAARVDYVEFFDPDTLTPVDNVRRGSHMALAVFVGKTRLIDNALL